MREVEIVILVLGGVRSGKSEYAESLARRYEKVIYVATSKRDFGMDARIAAHQSRRPTNWRTLEKYRDFGAEDFCGSCTALLDCTGVMCTNLMFELENLEQLSEAELYRNVWREFEGLLHAAQAAGAELIIVSNEVGCGLVSEHRIGNQFRDLLGAVNKSLAALADQVFYMVAGIPMKIK